MLCQICQQPVKTRRNLSNLLMVETHHICEYCYQRTPLIPRYQVYPIEDYIMHHHSMLAVKQVVDPRAYMSFLSFYYQDYYKQKDQSIFLYFDWLSDTLLSLLDQMKLGHLYVVTLYENIKKEGDTI